MEDISYAQEIKNLNRRTRGFSYQFSQETASFHRQGMSSQSGRKIIAIHASLSKNASDDFAFISSLHKIGCLSTAHKTLSRWSTTSNSNSTREILDSKNKKLGKTIIHQCLNCYIFKAQATQQLMGELPSTPVQISRPFLTTGLEYAGPISLRLDHHIVKQL